MAEQGPILVSSKDARFITATRFVGLCVALEDVVITNQIITGQAVCPITQQTISLEYGLCQETKETCSFHS